MSAGRTSGGVLDSWEREKMVLVFKMSSLVACNLSCIAYVRITEPHLGSEYFSILIPSMIFGYVVINTSEIIVMHLNQAHNFIEMCTALSGVVGSLICCAYQCYKWMGALIDSSGDGENPFPGYDCFLSVTLLINAVSLAMVATIRVMERRRDSAARQ